MKLNFYSIFDVAAGVYQNPFTSKTHGEVTRSFSDIAQDAEHPIGQHPEDYTLFCLGTFNDGTGEIIGKPPEKIATALELIAITKNVNTDNVEQLDTHIEANAGRYPQ